MKTRANFSDVESISIGLRLFGETIKRSTSRSRFAPLRRKEKDNTGQQKEIKICCKDLRHRGSYHAWFEFMGCLLCKYNARKCLVVYMSALFSE